MNLVVSCLISLLVYSIISLQSASSASFPNPPQRPPANASDEDWEIFFRLLHNYYAIIARPRFGKRYDSIMTRSKPLSLFDVNNLKSGSSSLSEHEINYMLSENNHNGNNDQQINIDDLDAFINSERQQRRRRR